MSAAQNRQIIQEALADVAAGKPETFLDALADDVVLETAEYPQDILKIQGPYRGKEGMLEFLGLGEQYFEILAFESRDFVAEDDKVVVVVYEKARARATGKELEQEIVQIWTLRDGKIVHCKLCEDTYAIIESLKASVPPT